VLGYAGRADGFAVQRVIEMEIVNIVHRLQLGGRWGYVHGKETDYVTFGLFCGVVNR